MPEYANRLAGDQYMGRLLDKVSSIVHGITGIQLGERQRSMVDSRVARRMLDLKISDPRQYDAYLDANHASETEVLVALLTTHHTFFFREFEQFEYMRDRGLPAIAEALKAAGRKHLRAWAMACSRGQEVYSLAMFLHAHWPKLMIGGTFEVLGTDVDAESVEIAKNGVYRIDEIRTIPTTYVGNHWARGTGEIANFVKVKKSLRDTTKFTVGNLMKLTAPSAGEAFDLIFCRNVFLYFTQEQVAAITSKIIPFLAPHSYFVIGTTESLSGLKLPINYLGSSIYQQPRPTAAKPAVATATATTPAAMPMPTPIERPLIRVFCVDDSPTIQALLKSILNKEHGFEIVDIAMNGEEALQKAPSLKYDIMTLDIHMPIKSGVDYLAERQKPNHPPVVILSSISREESTLGQRTLELGAVDYVEKPSLANITDRADELRMKLRCAVTSYTDNTSSQIAATAHALAKSLERVSQVSKQQSTLRVIYAGMSDRPKLMQLLKSLARPQPPTVILIDGPEALIAPLTSTLQPGCSLPVKAIASNWPPSDLSMLNDAVWVAAAEAPLPALTKVIEGRRTVFLVYDSVSSKTLRLAKTLSKGPLILEDPLTSSHTNVSERRSQATQVLPYTSFLFDSDYILNRD